MRHEKRPLVGSQTSSWRCFLQHKWSCLALLPQVSLFTSSHLWGPSPYCSALTLLPIEMRCPTVRVVHTLYKKTFHEVWRFYKWLSCCMCHKLKWKVWDNVVVRHTKRLLHSQMFLAGLYLPTSDMDIVIINSHCTDIPRALRAIGNILVENQMAKNIQVRIH